jgi:SAM-dependent methyltransferase
MNSRGRASAQVTGNFRSSQSVLRRRHQVSLNNASILDAGCGAGHTLTLIEERFHPSTLTAFDIVPSQVEAAQLRGTSAEVFVADITALQLPAESFDAAFVCGVLHHCREWRRGLAEIARVLRSGGVLLIEEPGVAHLRFERLLTGKSVALDAGFSLDALRLEMARHGLGVLSQQSLYFGLFGSFLCVKGAAVADDRLQARAMLRVIRPERIAPGQEAPA